MAHEPLGVKSEKHKPGCVVHHVTYYQEGNTCSHRWQAAKRARAETRIKYRDANVRKNWAWPATKANQDKLAILTRRGQAAERPRNRSKLRFTVEPFGTQYHPWLNQAHHIIPSSVLRGMLDDISLEAGPRHAHAMEVMMNGLLDEPYNVNDEPNMMMLPVHDDDAIAMGLPRHLGGAGSGGNNHRDYNRVVRQKIVSELQPHYKALMAAIKTRKHKKRDEMPTVRPILESISNTTYDAILSQTALYRERGADDVALDIIAPSLF